MPTAFAVRPDLIIGMCMAAGRSSAGIVRLNRGEGCAVRPTLIARKVHFEIDLAVEN